MVHTPLSPAMGLRSTGAWAAVGLELWAGGAMGGGLSVPALALSQLLSVCCSDGSPRVPRGAAEDERHAGDADEEDGHPGQAGEQH